jgi:hypothetical protein
MEVRLHKLEAHVCVGCFVALHGGRFASVSVQQMPMAPGSAACYSYVPPSIQWFVFASHRQVIGVSSPVECEGDDPNPPP